MKIEKIEVKSEYLYLKYTGENMDEVFEFIESFKIIEFSISKSEKDLYIHRLREMGEVERPADTIHLPKDGYLLYYKKDTVFSRYKHCMYNHAFYDLFVVKTEGELKNCLHVQGIDFD